VKERVSVQTGSVRVGRSCT